MIKNHTSLPSELWKQTAAHAASEARWLGPVAGILFVVAMLLIVGEFLVVPILEVLRSSPLPSLMDAIRQIVRPWINAGAAIALAWALWEARLYLKRLENGEVWVASTMKFLERIGECLLVSAVFSALVAPTINLWVHHRSGLDLSLNATTLALLGLGLLLTLMAKVLSQVLQTAEELKADSDTIV